MARKSNGMQGMGQDPGSTNFGYTIIDAKPTGFELLEIGMIETTIRNITEETQYKKPTKADRAKAAKQGKRLTKHDMPSKPPLSGGFPVYYDSVNDLIKDYQLSWYVAERFQTRGISGPVIEMVSLMNGITTTLCYQNNIQFRLIVASQWKNAINKVSNLEDIYEYAKQYSLTPHECDSTGIILYQMHQLGFMTFDVSLPLWRSAITRYMENI